MTKVLPSPLFWAIMALILLSGIISLSVFYFAVYPTPQVQEVIFSPVTKLNPSSITLNLASPEDSLLTFEAELLVAGKTKANEKLIITTNDVDNLITSQPDGNFSTTVKLKPGANYLTVTAFDSSGNIQTENRVVYYSEEKL